MGAQFQFPAIEGYVQRMDSATWLGLGTLDTAVIGLTLVGWQLREQRRGMRAEFGNLYIERYWQIDDALLLERKGTEKHRQHRHRYLRLFEDEFDVATLGFLDADQWRAWHAVLDDSKAQLRIKDDLNVCNPSDDQFRRIRACLKQRDTEGGAHGIADCWGSKDVECGGRSQVAEARRLGGLVRHTPPVG